MAKKFLVKHPNGTAWVGTTHVQAHRDAGHEVIGVDADGLVPFDDEHHEEAMADAAVKAAAEVQERGYAPHGEKK